MKKQFLVLKEQIEKARVEIIRLEKQKKFKEAKELEFKFNKFLIFSDVFNHMYFGENNEGNGV